MFSQVKAQELVAYPSSSYCEGEEGVKLTFLQSTNNQTYQLVERSNLTLTIAKIAGNGSNVEFDGFFKEGVYIIIGDVDRQLIVTEIPYPVVSPIDGSKSVLKGEKQSYLIEYSPTCTYKWVVTGGTIKSGAETNDITVLWDKVGKGTVDVSVTTKDSKCSKSAEQLIIEIK